MYRLPLVANIDDNEYFEYEAHTSPITRMRVTYDDSCLITSAEDGSIWMFKVWDREGARSKRDKESTYSEEVNKKSARTLDYAAC